MGGDIFRRKVKHLAQAVISRKGGLVLRHLSELAIKPFDYIRRVYDFPNLSGICEECGQDIPVAPDRPSSDRPSML